MKYFRHGIAILSIILVSSSLTGCVTVVKTGEEASLTGETSLEESIDVTSFWDSQAVPEIKENALELNEFLREASGDIKSLANKGRYSMGTSGSLNFAVHGLGTVTAVDTESSAGTIEVSLANYDGNVKVLIQIGKVFKKTTIRDYLSFLDINDYDDQIKFAQLSKNINAYIGKNITADAANLKGKTIEFYGCFTYDKNEELLITPVVINEK